MDKKNRKLLYIIVGAIELAILIFCLIVSILCMQNTLKDVSDPASRAQMLIQQNGPFIGWLQGHPTQMFIFIVVPVFIIFFADAAYLIYYAVKKPSDALSKEEEEALKEQAREEARREVLAEMKGEAPAEESAPVQESAEVGSESADVGGDGV